MKEIKLVVFDMAGTTVNEDNVVYKTLARALQGSGVEVSLEKVLEIGAGKEKFQAIVDILEALGNRDGDPKAIFKDFQGLLVEAYAQLEVVPYEGVEELFQRLRSHGVRVVLNTGYDRVTAQSLLDKLGWKTQVHIDALITADDVRTSRPSPEMIHRAMELYRIQDPSLVLKAGDSAIDIQEGKNANCGVTVGVLTGAQTREQLASAGPTVILGALHELGDLMFPIRGHMKK